MIPHQNVSQLLPKMLPHLLISGSSSRLGIDSLPPWRPASWQWSRPPRGVA